MKHLRPDPSPPTPLPEAERGEQDKFYSPSPCRGGGRGEGSGLTIPSRREMLRRIACGFGSVALAGLLAEEVAGATPGAHAPGSPGADPLAPRRPHFPARAKRVIFLFMHGGVSHVDTFDPKPKLAEMNGKPLPYPKPKFEFAPTGNLLRSPWKFKKHGQSGIEVSELFPEVASCIDDVCVIRSMNG